MRKAKYTAADGRKFSTMLPDDMPDEQAHVGVPVGPPDLVDAIVDGYSPREFAVRLHNELHDRGVLTSRDARRDPGTVVAALMRAHLKDAMWLIETWERIEQGD